MSYGQELKRISVAKKTVAFPWCQLHGNYCPLVGSLSNYDGYNNENGKKAIGLDWRNTTLHVHHALLYISLPSQHDYDVKCLISRFLEGDNDLLFLFLNFDSLTEFNSRNNCQHLTNWTRWNKRDKVWSSANALFKRRFRSCRRCCCLRWFHGFALRISYCA